MATAADPGTRLRAGGRRVFFLDVVTFFFLLTAPYLNFAAHNGFVLEAANLVIVAGFFCLAVVGALLLVRIASGVLRVVMITALVLVFADAQFTGGLVVLLLTAGAFAGLLFLRSGHRTLVMAAVFGAMIAATLVQTSLRGDLRRPALSGVSVAAPKSGAPDLPVYVHIVLDGQLGIDGFSDAVPVQQSVKRAVLELFSKYGFRVFSRAYSSYDKTELSVSAAFNAPGDTALRKLYSQSDIPDSFKLDRNAHFDRLGALGYRINVFQSTFMDYCAGAREHIVYCESYDQTAVSSESTVHFTLREKVAFVLSVYSDLLFLKRQIGLIYGPVRTQASALGIDLPQWRILHLHRTGPLSVFPVLDRMASRLAGAKRGNMYFAHLMIPHEPFAVGPSCSLRRPVLEWQSRVGPTWDGGPVSFESVQSRLSVYGAYAGQVRCTFFSIEKLLQTMKDAGTFEDATIIIHGDHGSRISRVDPAAANIALISPEDYVNTFSTLFAIKSPAVPPGLDRQVASLKELMRRVGAKDDIAAAPPNTSRRQVYLRQGTEMARGHRLCRVVPVLWLRASELGFLQSLRRWSERECTHVAAPIYRKVQQVTLTETWDAVR